jgi:hypothetical protein
MHSISSRRKVSPFCSSTRVNVSVKQPPFSACALSSATCMKMSCVMHGFQLLQAESENTELNKLFACQKYSKIMPSHLPPSSAPAPILTDVQPTAFKNFQEPQHLTRYCRKPDDAMSSNLSECYSESRLTTRLAVSKKSETPSALSMSSAINKAVRKCTERLTGIVKKLQTVPLRSRQVNCMPFESDEDLSNSCLAVRPHCTSRPQQDFATLSCSANAPERQASVTDEASCSMLNGYFKSWPSYDKKSYSSRQMRPEFLVLSKLRRILPLNENRQMAGTFTLFLMDASRSAEGHLPVFSRSVQVTPHRHDPHLEQPVATSMPHNYARCVYSRCCFKSDIVQNCHHRQVVCTSAEKADHLLRLEFNKFLPKLPLSFAGGVLCINAILGYDQYCSWVSDFLTGQMSGPSPMKPSAFPCLLALNFGITPRFACRFFPSAYLTIEPYCKPEVCDILYYVSKSNLPLVSDSPSYMPMLCIISKTFVSISVQSILRTGHAMLESTAHKQVHHEFATCNIDLEMVAKVKPDVLVGKMSFFSVVRKCLKYLSGRNQTCRYHLAADSAERATYHILDNQDSKMSKNNVSDTIAVCNSSLNFKSEFCGLSTVVRKVSNLMKKLTRRLRLERRKFPELMTPTDSLLQQQMAESEVRASVNHSVFPKVCSTRLTSSLSYRSPVCTLLSVEHPVNQLPFTQFSLLLNIPVIKETFEPVVWSPPKRQSVRKSRPPVKKRPPAKKPSLPKRRPASRKPAPRMHSVARKPATAKNSQKRLPISRRSSASGVKRSRSPAARQANKSIAARKSRSSARKLVPQRRGGSQSPLKAVRSKGQMRSQSRAHPPRVRSAPNSRNASRLPSNLSHASTRRSSRSSASKTPVRKNRAKNQASALQSKARLGKSGGRRQEASGSPARMHKGKGTVGARPRTRNRSGSPHPKSPNQLRASKLPVKKYETESRRNSHSRARSPRIPSASRTHLASRTSSRQSHTVSNHSKYDKSVSRHHANSKLPAAGSIPEGQMSSPTSAHAGSAQSSRRRSKLSHSSAKADDHQRGAVRKHSRENRTSSRLSPESASRKSSSRSKNSRKRTGGVPMKHVQEHSAHERRNESKAPARKHGAKNQADTDVQAHSTTKRDHRSKFPLATQTRSRTEPFLNDTSEQSRKADDNNGHKNIHSHPSLEQYASKSHLKPKYASGVDARNADRLQPESQDIDSSEARAGRQDSFAGGQNEPHRKPVTRPSRVRTSQKSLVLPEDEGDDSLAPELQPLSDSSNSAHNVLSSGFSKQSVTSNLAKPTAPHSTLMIPHGTFSTGRGRASAPTSYSAVPTAPSSQLSPESSESDIAFTSPGDAVGSTAFRSSSISKKPFVESTLETNSDQSPDLPPDTSLRSPPVPQPIHPVLIPRQVVLENSPPDFDITSSRAKRRHTVNSSSFVTQKPLVKSVPDSSVDQMSGTYAEKSRVASTSSIPLHNRTPSVKFSLTPTEHEKLPVKAASNASSIKQRKREATKKSAYSDSSAEESDAASKSSTQFTADLRSRSSKTARTSHNTVSVPTVEHSTLTKMSDQELSALPSSSKVATRLEKQEPAFTNKAAIARLASSGATGLAVKSEGNEHQTSFKTYVPPAPPLSPELATSVKTLPHDASQVKLVATTEYKKAKSPSVLVSSKVVTPTSFASTMEHPLKPIGVTPGTLAVAAPVHYPSVMTTENNVAVSQTALKPACAVPGSLSLASPALCPLASNAQSHEPSANSSISAMPGHSP